MRPNTLFFESFRNASKIFFVKFFHNFLFIPPPVLRNTGSGGFGFSNIEYWKWLENIRVSYFFRSFIS